MIYEMPLKKSAKKGIEIVIYATGPDRNIINRLISHKINVYIGSEDSLKHFMICDDDIVIISQKDENRIKPTPMGRRKGLILDDLNAVKQYIQRFEKLKINARKEKIRGLIRL